MEGETRGYSPESLSRRIRTLAARETRAPEEDRELDVLRSAQAALYRPLATLPPVQRGWLELWELCSSQRYGQGMTLGTLVHSEVWNNLEQLGYEGREKERAFRAILGADDVFRKHVGTKEESE